MDLPWTMARDLHRAAEALELQALRRQAVALRAAQADAQAWRDWLKATAPQ